MRKILVISLLLGLCSCASVQKLAVSTMQVDKPYLRLADPDPMVLQPYPSNVVVSGAKPGTFGNSEDILNKDNGIGFLMSSDSYGNLIVDQAKIQAYIAQLKSELTAYKKYYESN